MQIEISMRILTHLSSYIQIFPEYNYFCAANLTKLLLYVVHISSDVDLFRVEFKKNVSSLSERKCFVFIRIGDMKMREWEMCQRCWRENICENIARNDMIEICIGFIRHESFHFLVSSLCYLSFFVVSSYQKWYIFQTNEVNVKKLSYLRASWCRK